MAETYEVEQDFTVDLPGGRKALCLGGEPVRQLNPGWHARKLYLGLPTGLLLLENDDGSWAIWFVDSELNRLGGTFAELETGLRQSLLQAMCDLIMEIWCRLVAHPPGERLDGKPLEFLRLPGAIRRQILDAVVSLMNFDTRFDHWRSPERRHDGYTTARLGDRQLLLRPEYLEGFGHPDALQRAYVEALSREGLYFHSPVDNAPLRASHAYWLGGGRVAYRLVDPQSDFVFYVVCDHIYYRFVCLYIPEAYVVFSSDPQQTRAMLPDLGFAMLRHVIEHGEAIAGYIADPDTRLSHFWTGLTAVHLGHVLWNDLSGIERLISGVPASRLPEFLVFDAQVTPEMYGPLDRIFPELEGKVIRSERSLAEHVADFYAQGRLPIKSSAMRVPATLGGKILRVARDDADNIAAVVASRAAAQAGPVIVLGLRTENRTVVDLRGFCVAVLETLESLLPGGATLVVDGHNSRGGKDGDFIWSHGEALAAQSPIEIERSIVDLLSETAARGPIRIVSTIGKPLAVSLLWTEQADMFVALWGAGLAKYRWVCNRPGLIVTSRWNLDNLNDLHIYSAPSFQESPAPICFIAPEAVTDRPDAALLVDLQHGNRPSIGNFDVDLTVFAAALTDAAERFIDSQRLPAAAPAKRGRRKADQRAG